MYPLDNIKVTFELSFSAAKQLRDLAVSGDDRLRDIGIVKVKINNGSEISLLDRDNFKKPVLPLFTARKDSITGVKSVSNKVRSPSGNRRVNSLKQSSSKQSAKTKSKSKSCTIGDTQVETFCTSTQGRNYSDPPVGVIAESYPFPVSVTEKKRVVLISQGTATEEPKRQVEPSLETVTPCYEGIFQSPPKVPRLDFVCSPTNGTISTFAATADPETCSDPLPPSTKSASLLETQNLSKTEAPVAAERVAAECQTDECLHSTASKDNSTNEKQDVLPEECNRIEEKADNDPIRPQDSISSVLSIANKSIEFVPNDGIEDIKASACTTTTVTMVSSSAITHTEKHAVSEMPYYRSHSKSPIISTNNFEALQMLSDICVFETNLASQPAKDVQPEPDYLENKFISKGSQTIDDMINVIPQNVRLKFVDECEIPAKVCDMGTAFKLTVAKCGQMSRKSVTPPILSSISECRMSSGKHVCSNIDRTLSKNMPLNNECGCLTGNYHLCSRSRRPRRHSFSSSSCHVMTLRSRDESDDCSSDSNEKVNEKYASSPRTSGMFEEESSNSSVEHLESQDRKFPFELDCNNNDPYLVDAVSKTFGVSGICNTEIDGTRYPSSDESLCNQISPLAMLKGAVNRIPSPDVPCHQRPESSPKNIVDEYTEIIHARLEDHETNDDDSLVCPDTCDVDIPPSLDSEDYRNGPPPLLFKEFGARVASHVQAASLPDTPPPLSESAVTARACLSKWNTPGEDSNIDVEVERSLERNEKDVIETVVCKQTETKVKDSSLNVGKVEKMSLLTPYDGDTKQKDDTVKEDTEHSTCISSESFTSEQNGLTDTLGPTPAGDGSSQEIVANDTKDSVSTEDVTYMKISSESINASKSFGEDHEEPSRDLSLVAPSESSVTDTQGSSANTVNDMEYSVSRKDVTCMKVSSEFINAPGSLEVDSDESSRNQSVVAASKSSLMDTQGSSDDIANVTKGPLGTEDVMCTKVSSKSINTPESIGEEESQESSTNPNVVTTCMKVSSESINAPGSMEVDSDESSRNQSVVAASKSSVMDTQGSSDDIASDTKGRLGTEDVMCTKVSSKSINTSESIGEEESQESSTNPNVVTTFDSSVTDSQSSPAGTVNDSKRPSSTEDIMGTKVSSKSINTSESIGEEEPQESSRNPNVVAACDSSVKDSQSSPAGTVNDSKGLSSTEDIMGTKALNESINTSESIGEEESEESSRNPNVVATCDSSVKGTKGSSNDIANDSKDPISTEDIMGTKLLSESIDTSEIVGEGLKESSRNPSVAITCDSSGTDVQILPASKELKHVSDDTTVIGSERLPTKEIAGCKPVSGDEDTSITSSIVESDSSSINTRPTVVKEQELICSEAPSTEMPEDTVKENSIVEACQPADFTYDSHEEGKGITGSEGETKDDDTKSMSVMGNVNTERKSHKKKLKDGLEDLSYVLKRIQGDENDRHAGAKKRRLTRSQRLSDGTMRSLKRVRYSR